MAFVQTHLKEIISVLVPFISWILTNFAKRRARLVWSVNHASSLLFNETMIEDGKEISRAMTAHTASLFFQNPSKEPVTKIELVFNWQPKYFGVWPKRAYDEKRHSDDRYSLIFDNLAPKEYFGIDLIGVGNIPELITVRSHETVPTQVKMLPQPVHPRWKQMLAVYLMAAGVAASVYGLITLVQLLILKTPVWFFPASP